MGSDNSNGRGRDASRRTAADRRRSALLRWESLELRTMLSNAPTTFVPTSPNVLDVEHGPLADEGSTLIQVYAQYQQYRASGQSGAFATSPMNANQPYVKFSGDSVAVTIYYSGDTATYLSDLSQLGFRLGGLDANNQVVEGLIPIANLPNLAAVKTTVPNYQCGTVGVAPQFVPVAKYQGVADNEAETTLGATTARADFNVTGAGVTVGVLSDSVNKLNGGLAASAATGDIPKNPDGTPAVNVLFDSDLATGNTDEGRAMLENIHDIAPGASLAYYNAFSTAGGETTMAAGIRALATQAGAKVIVDDIGFLTEPYYSPGVSAQAIADVTTNNNVAYFSALGNSGPSAGIETAFRPVNTTLHGITGRFQEFNPGDTTSTTEAVTVNSTGTIALQFDEPFGHGVTSEVDLYIFDSAGNVVFGGTANPNQNNIATQMPYQVATGLAPGTYTVAYAVAAGGTDPGRVALYTLDDYQPNVQGISFSQQYGTAGGITYPSGFGHAAAADTIGVGASPYYLDPPVSTVMPIPSETFSSTGPAVQDLDANGNKIALQVRQQPVISASDGGNTSFFGQTGAIPAGVAINQYNLPNFFGTSSAAPNAAAVAALMKQLSPNVTSAEITTALENSALPMNGTPKGTYNPQSGYGLVQAEGALAAVDRLRVISAVPSGGQVDTSVPQYIGVTFNRPVDPASLSSSDLVFVAVPAGVTVTVGTPIYSAANPSVVLFPLSYSYARGASANGIYSYVIPDNSVRSADGRTLVGYSSFYGVADVTPPKITNLTLTGRFAYATFSEPLNPATISRASVLLVRTGSSGVFNNPTNVIVTSDPRAVITYDPTTNRVILDLSKLDQSQLPSDNYDLVITDAVTDLAGNKLDGEYTGTFPTGNGVAGGTFNYYIPNQILQAPQIVSLRLAPASDTGIAADNNTNSTQPTFIGSVSVPFPGTVAGVQIVAQVNALNGGVFDLGTGAALSTDALSRPRGFVGSPEVAATTDIFGNFSFRIPAALADGFDTLRVVAVGQSDRPPLAGYSSQRDLAFRIDTTVPEVVSSTPTSGTALSSLTRVTLNVVDGVLPADLGNPQSVPIQFQVPALNPATAENISNYSLINLGADLRLGTADDVDESSFITSATYVPGPTRVQANAPYTGQIVLNFATGLPGGFYVLRAKGSATTPGGITDAAGNSLDGAPVTNPASDFTATFDLNPEPAYITSMLAASVDPNGTGAITLSEPRSYFEEPVPGVTPRAAAPPTSFYIDFSQPLDRSRMGAVNPLDPNSINPDYVQLIRTADDTSGANNAADGDFGTDPTFQIPNAGQALDLPFSRITGTTLRVVNSIPGATFGQPGYLNRLVLTLAPGTTLPADHYRLYIPNKVGNYSLTSATPEDLRLFDVFGNQIDGEFNGNPLATDNTQWQDLLPTGQERVGLSGDGTAGGSFETSYIVVPNGNVIYARPDYIDDPILTTDDPDGSPQKPYPVLAPEAVADAANGGDLNSVSNFTDPRFNAATAAGSDYNYSASGHFDRSAFFAAQQLATRGPVVIVAEPSVTTSVSTLTGLSYTKTFVLQAKALNFDGTLGDGSASVPADTDLVFEPGSVLKLYNATLLVQNQGSSIQTVGGPTPAQQVIFTSLFNDAIDGPVNGQPASTTPTGGDWGGLALRNFDDQEAGRAIQFPVDGQIGVSGADDALSIINNTQLSYGGGTVPKGATVGTAVNFFRYDEITLFNSRPVISNVVVSNAAPPTGTTAATGTQAGISVDLDSLRVDDLAQGVLIRQVTSVNNSLNGIYVRAEASGFIEQTDAIPYQDEFTNSDGTARREFSMFAPLPYIMITRLNLGAGLVQGAAGAQDATPPENRLYVNPGSVLKFQRGAALEVVAAGASLNIGSHIYLDQFDANPNFSPQNADGTANAAFQAPGTGDAGVIFTSLFDNAATTTGPFVDPLTGRSAVLVAPIDSANSGGINQPTPGNVPALARWGDISIVTGGVLVMNGATVEYGGGEVNEQAGTLTNPNRDALNFQDILTRFNPLVGFGQQTRTFLGTRAYVTNNNFYDNSGAAVGITPDGLLAADPLRPLESGNPFLRGNIMQRNEINGLEVLSGAPSTSLINTNPYNPRTLYAVAQTPNLYVNSVWELTDVTYVLRGTIALDGDEGESVTLPGSASGLAELKPHLTLTLQSALPGTLLANGQTIAKPGEQLIVKLLNPGGTGAAQGTAAGLGSYIGAENQAGAGFTVGYDNGVDANDPVLDQVGNESQIRITGIAGNESTGQKRVPVVLTSLRDDTVGTTVRGVTMNQAAFGNTTAPAAGDGGLIVFGANSLIDYNLLDPRDGNIIDNADLRYLTRVEVQGGGVVEEAALDSTFNFIQTKFGITADTQFNGSRAVAITNSNFSTFRDEAILTHPGPDSQIAFPLINGLVGNVTRDNTVRGEPTDLLTINDTFSNSPFGVQIFGETADNILEPDTTEYLALNNSFYNNTVGVQLNSVQPDLVNVLSRIHFTAMDNIFANNGTAVLGIGQLYGSQGQYNLFSSNTTDVNDTNSTGIANIATTQTGISGQADFLATASGNLHLTPASAAIDAARSELTLDNQTSGGSDATLRPLTTQVLDARGGIRIEDGRIYDHRALGSNDVLTLYGYADPTNILTLPGGTLRNNGTTPQNYLDEWVAALPGTPGAYPGPTTNNGANFWYLPIGGERDQDGNIRMDDPAVANVGYGSSPFFDIGAYEYRQFNPPKVAAVTATVPTSAGATTVPFYAVGSVVGASAPPTAIQITFTAAVDPSTLNAQTVLLEASGGTGVFGNPGQTTPPERFINLSGKLSYDATTNTLTINLAGSGLSLANDEYRLFLLGNGSNVIANAQGIALDGVNTVNDDPNGAQLALPSGADNTPGSNFYLTFYVNTTAPSIVAGTFSLSAASITGVRDDVTDINKPTFVGRITATFPPANALAGQRVVIDVSSKGNGVYDLLGVATGITDSGGNFSATATTALPDSPINVGPDGLLGTADDLGFSTARVRVVNSAGSSSSLTDPNATTKFVIDTRDPFITAASPTAGSQSTDQGSGIIPVSITVDENLNPASLTASSIVVTRAGADGALGTADDVAVSIDPSSISLTNLNNIYGSQVLRFNIVGATANDLYRVTLKGTGASKITDIAGNPLSGAFSGTFPTGNGSGSDFNLTFFVFASANSRILFVAPATTGQTGTIGSRENPYPTIMAAMAAAGSGDTIAVVAGSGANPNVYAENVVLKPLIRLISVDAASTDGTLIPGLSGEAVLRATSGVTVNATNVQSLAGFSSEVSGFTIASPLVGDPSVGTISPSTIGILASNSDVLIDRDNIIDGGIGVAVIETAGAARVPRIVNDLIAGNSTGITILDQGATSYLNAEGPGGAGVDIVNNTITFNTNGLVVSSATSAGLQLADVVNNIFWQNASLGTTRTGNAIFAAQPGRILVRDNDFYANGPSVTSPADDTVGVGGQFNPALLGPAPDALGNISGDPAFASPRDPRPAADGPASFLLDGNFDPTRNSAAVDNALESVAPTLDFRYRARVDITGKGLAGRGPADLGAFEYGGTATSTVITSTGTSTTATAVAASAVVGGASRVVATSLTDDGSALAGGKVAPGSSSGLSSIIVTFSNPLDPTSVQAADLVLSGSGLSSTNPAHATSATLVDDHTVRFGLSGGFNPVGAVSLNIPTGALRDAARQNVRAFSDIFRTGAAATTSGASTAVSRSAIATPLGAATAAPTTAAAPTVSTPTAVVAATVVATPSVVAAPAAAPASETGSSKSKAAHPKVASHPQGASSKPFRLNGLPSYFRRKP